MERPSLFDATRRAHRPVPLPPRAARGVVTLADENTIRIKFSARHDPFITAVKSLRNYRYDPQDYSWLIDIGNLADVQRLAALHGWTLSDRLTNIEAPDAASIAMKVTAEGEHLIVDGPYRAVTWEILQEVASYDRKTGRWFLPAEEAFDTILDLQKVSKIQFIGDTNEILDRIREGIEMVRLSRALEPRGDFTVTDRVARDLAARPFQIPGVEYLVRARRSFAWATMGAGKSSVSLAAVEHLNEYPLLIVCPAGLKSNWADEVTATVPHRTVYIAEGKRPRQPLFRPDIWIVNYDILGGTHGHSWAKRFTVDPPASLIADEGHRLKNPKTGRTQAVIGISDAMTVDAPRYLLTGTPVRNKRHEIIPQLHVIGRGDQFGDKKRIREDERLSRRLRSVCAWRPDPKEVLRSLGHDGENPPPNIVKIDGDPHIMAEYRKAEADILAYIADKARKEAERLGVDPNAAEVEAAMRASGAEHLMAVNTLCRLAGRAKVQAAIEWVDDFLESDQKLLIFAENHDIMDAVARDKMPQIRGGISHAIRKELCDRFQGRHSPDLPAMMLQIDAAGEGLTLTEAWNALFVQLSWVPGAIDQAVARAAWRMNDPHPVQAHFLVCADTIDEDRMAVLDIKRAEMNAVTDGDRDQAALATSTFGDVLTRLLRRAI